MMLLLAFLGLLHLAVISAIPAPVSLDRCPDTRGMIGTCAQQCFPGTRCANGLICCRNGCGTSCMKPVDPCKDKVCLKGQKCELQTVRCIRAPCPPIATCVPDSAENTCKDKVCQKGEKCELRTVMCIRHPCPPIPTCVPDSDDPCKGKCSKRETCLTLDSGLNVCVPDKNGFCPIRLDGKISCQFAKPIYECSHDYDCKDKLKCCSGRCGGKQCLASSWFTGHA